jgi:hypothetical protein
MNRNERMDLRWRFIRLSSDLSTIGHLRCLLPKYLAHIALQPTDPLLLHQHLTRTSAGTPPRQRERAREVEAPRRSSRVTTGISACVVLTRRPRG